MAKQLIEIQAVFLKAGDLIFDYKYRHLQKIEFVAKETADGSRHCGIGELSNIHISYGLESNVADNFQPNCKVLILVDTDELDVIDAKNIMLG